MNQKQKKTKILFICQYYYPERTNMTMVCEELAKRNYDITVLTGLPNYHMHNNKVPKEYHHQKKRIEQINGVKVLRCFEISRRNNVISLILNYISFYFSSQLKVKRLDKDFDEVICYQYSPVTMAAAGMKYAKKHNKKFTLYCFDLWPESLKTYKIKENSPIFKIVNKISKKIYKSTDKIVVSSESFIEYFTVHHQIPKEKIVHLPQFSENYGSQIKNIPKPDCVHLLYAGNVGKMQGLDCLIDAISLINTKKKFVVDIVGSGSELERLKNIAHTKHLDKKIVFHGEKPSKDMPKYYNQASALLLTLKDDGSYISKTVPLKLQSYMSTEKPILASINGSAADIMLKYKCGFRTKANDPKAFASNIEKFINTQPVIKYESDPKFYFEENIKQFIKIITETGSEK